MSEYIKRTAKQRKLEARAGQRFVKKYIFGQTRKTSKPVNPLEGKSPANLYWRSLKNAKARRRKRNKIARLSRRANRRAA